MSPATVAPIDEVAAGESVVSIGFFDGVHRGHRAIIERAVRHAGQLGVRSAVVTFDRHPLEVVRPGSQPPLLQPHRTRLRTLADTGVDLVVTVPFDDELRHLAPAAFVDRTLAPLAPREVVVGANFRFGHKAAGDVATLVELGQARGFDVEAVSLLELDGVVVSSTEIRQRLGRGDVETAAAMLGRPPAVEGVVVRGDQRGHELGFPTCNLAVDSRVAVPAIGIYAGVAHLPEGRRVDAAVSVGVNPTFGGEEQRVEAHLLDFDEDLYGVELTVDFRARLRGEERFDSAESLATQIRDDVDRARRVLAETRSA